MHDIVQNLGQHRCAGARLRYFERLCCAALAQRCMAAPPIAPRYRRAYTLDDFTHHTAATEYKARVHEYLQDAAGPPLLQCVVTIRDRFGAEFLLLPIDHHRRHRADNEGPWLAGFIWVPDVAAGGADRDVSSYLRKRLLQFTSDHAQRIERTMGAPIEWSVVGRTKRADGERRVRQTT